MKRLLSLLLVLIMLCSLLPTVPVLAAQQPAQTPTEAAYAEVDAVFDRIDAAEEAPAKKNATQSEKAEAAKALVMATDSYVEGSLEQNGNVFTWWTDGGIRCVYNPRMRELRKNMTPDEGIDEIVNEPVATKGGTPSGKQVYLVGPYYGYDNDFTNQYKTEARRVAQAIGDTDGYTLYSGTAATVDKVAEAVSNGAVVFFDSHGATDYQNPNNEYDCITGASGSWLCLSSKEGLTEQDYNDGAAWNGEDAFVNGTVIANHMTKNSPNGILWMAICFGMGTDTMYKPLRAKGVEVVYGYSEAVTFGGDYLYEETFWGEMIQGKTVAESIATMKNTWGQWDYSTQIASYYNDYGYSTISAARADFAAFPWVISSEDTDHPGKRTTSSYGADTLQTVKSTYSLGEVQEVTNPTDPGEILTEAYALAPGEELPYEATLTGTVTQVTTAYNASYGNVTVIMTVPGYETMPIKCYRLSGSGADQIGVGDTITVTGTIVNFQHSSGDTEVEFTQGCTLDSWTDGSTTPDQPDIPDTPTDPAITYVKNPVSGTPYKFVMNQAGLGKQLGLTGTMNGYYYATSENIEEMVDVYLEAASGGYQLYFLANGTKTYLNVIPRPNDATKTNVVFQTLAENSIPTVYQLNTQFGYVVTTCANAEWYLGTYGTNSTIGASKTSYISDTATIGVSQFVAWFATTGEGSDTPDTPVTPPVEPDVPAGEGVTLSFASTANRTELTDEKQVWQQNGITVTNEKASSTSNVVDFSNPARFYKNSSLEIAYDGMIKLVADCVNETYAKAFADVISGAEVSIDGQYVTVQFPAYISRFYVELAAGQVRMNSITVYGAQEEPEIPDVPDEPDVPDQPEEPTLPPVLTEDTEIEMTLTEDLYIDLAGYSLSGILYTNGFKVYGKDSSTDTYNAENAGYFNCLDESGEWIVPEPICSSGEKTYLTVSDEYGYSFHRFELAVTHMSLAPEVVGVGYKAVLQGDEMIFAQLADQNAFTFRLQLEGYNPVYRYFGSDALASGDPIALRIRNYGVETFGEHKLYAQVGITLADGTVIDSEEIDLSFRWLAEQVDAAYTDYTQEQIAQLRELLEQFQVVKTWDLPNLFPAEVTSATLDLSNTANRLSWGGTQQIWAQNGIVLTNNQHNSTTAIANYAPIRLYAGSQVIIDSIGMTKLEFDCSGITAKYVTNLVSSLETISGATVTQSGTTVTVVLSAATDNVTFVMTAQGRAAALTVYS